MFVLASASPRRKSLLSLLIPNFDIVPADIDETVLADEMAEHYVLRMAKEKARRSLLIGKQKSLFKESEAIVLGSDTCVVVDDEILGKPTDLKDANRMLRKLSDRTHQVMTSVCIYDDRFDHEVSINVITHVTFRALSDLEIEHYWKTGEPQDKAGAYGIQGLGAIFVKQIMGSYTAVVGLPLYETTNLLQQVGIHPLQEKLGE